MNGKTNKLHLKKLGIDTYKEAVIFMRKDCHVCRSEGFDVPARIRVSLNDKNILATLHTINNGLLNPHEASLSKYAWELLGAKEGDEIHLSHPKPLQSLSFVRSKIYGEKLNFEKYSHIISDITKGYYSDIYISSFLTACAGGRLDYDEILDITNAMINVGERLTWPNKMVVDKHCVGGLPGNRTTLIVVPIVTYFGLTMPKTSSRAITSPAGTADTMEIFAPVNLDIKEMQKVVKQENGCIIWGGSVNLSPADDMLIRVEKALDIDSEGQLIASVLSKKVSAGSNNILIDVPVGPTAKVRTFEMANDLSILFKKIAKTLDIKVEMVISDGIQPIGRGIGPALEARDVLAVLKNEINAPKDLREKSLDIAGKIIEFSSDIKYGEGRKIAENILKKGYAFEKFKDICLAQGSFNEPPTASHTYKVLSKYCGRVTAIDNRQISRLAKLAGAPQDKAAGVDMHISLQSVVEKNEPLFTIHTESNGALNYALSLLEQVPEIIQLEAFE